MRRAFGAVFDVQNPPRTDINLRFQVSGSGAELYWIEAKNPIPADWKVGAAYDSMTLKFSLIKKALSDVGNIKKVTAIFIFSISCLVV